MLTALLKNCSSHRCQSPHVQHNNNDRAVRWDVRVAAARDGEHFQYINGDRNPWLQV